MHDLARALTRQQDQFECGARDQSRIVEGGPERGTSLSDSTRSRLWTALRATSLHGLSFTPPISSLMAHEKIADAAAKH